MTRFDWGISTIMAGAKNHDYHILPPDIWPVVGAFSALIHLPIREEPARLPAAA